MTRRRRPRSCASGDGSFLADARATLEDVTATVGTEFDVGEAAQEVDTLGGYLVTQIGRVPVRGEVVPGPGAFELEVLDADPRRVKKLRIARSRDPRGRNGDARAGQFDNVLTPAAAGTPPAEPSDGSARVSETSPKAAPGS